jgi:hypothetical protein
MRPGAFEIIVAGFTKLDSLRGRIGSFFVNEVFPGVSRGAVPSVIQSADDGVRHQLEVTFLKMGNCAARQSTELRQLEHSDDARWQHFHVAFHDAFFSHG